jgi:hypothetical protein
MWGILGHITAGTGEMGMVFTGEGIALAAAVLAVLVSVTTAYLSWRWRMEDTRKAELTLYFHRNSEKAQVVTTSGKVRQVGYNLVIWNRGPSVAKDIELSVFDEDGSQLQLLDVAPDEFPLDCLDPGTRYPIPWVISHAAHRRRFRCSVTWWDNRGQHHRSLPLRRGQTSL